MAESGEEWELSKENIRPIQQGRKQKVLKVALAPHPEEVIAQQRQSFENELRTYSGDDPLFVWCKYVKWVEQNYPKGGREGHIKDLVERCLSILKDEQKYFDDDRFIDIMLKYAALSGKALEVYNYMYSSNIGCKSAKFFINWSWELEQIGNFKKADEVLTEGMQRKAQPFDKIKSYHADFEIRLATKIKASVETNNYEAENNRSAFAVLKPQKKNMAPILRTGEAVIEKASSLLLNRQQPQPKSMKSSTKVPFKIFDSENINPSLPVQTKSGARNCLNPENYKENEQKPSKWNKVKMKSRSHIHEINPDFKFHCDEEKGDELHTPRSVPKTSNILSSRRRTPSPPIALFEPHDPMKRPMYPKNKVYGGAEEYSLEEIRAAAWLERKKQAEKEKLLAEQQKKIEEQAKKEEELKKQVEYLAKKIEMLENHVTTSNAKPCNILSQPSVNTHEFDFQLINNRKENFAEDKPFAQNYQTNSNVESLSHNNATEKNLINSVSCGTDAIMQKCSVFTSNKNTFDGLPQTHTNVIKQSSDMLPFTFYHDPTTKIIPELDNNASSKGITTISKDLNTLHVVSQNSDKQPPFFNNHTISQKSANLQIGNETEEVRKPDYKLSFTFYTDPTDKLLSEVNKVISKNDHNESNLSKVYQTDEACGTSKVTSFDIDSTEKLLSDVNKVVASQKDLNKYGESNLGKVYQINEACGTSKIGELPFTFYTDPTNKLPSEVDKVISSTKNVNKFNEPNLTKTNQTVKACGTSGVNDLPFTFYHDPTNTVSNVADNVLKKDTYKTHLCQELSDEDCENIPPKGYVQDKTKRELAGILEPSKNILYIPLEEQELDEDEDNESDFEDIINQDGRCCTDETLIPPSNTEQFSTAKFLASTPCVNKFNKIANTEKSNRISSKEIQIPSENTSDKKHCLSDENAIIRSELKLHKDSTLNSELRTTCNSQLSKKLSVIIETSENCSKSSSSSSSASLTKFNHLDQNSAHYININKHHSKSEPHEPSIISSVSQSSKCFHNSDEKDDLNAKKDVQKSDIFLVDFDPFDSKIIQNLLKAIKFDNYKHFYKSNRSIKTVKINENIQIGNESYVIENLVAEGAYAKVYKAVKPFGMYDSNFNRPLALKVCKKANEWEFYICSEIQRRLSERKILPDIKDSVMNITAAIKYMDGILLVNEYSSFGTLLDIINFYKKQNSPMPEFLTMFYTLQILHIVSKLHECNIIHGDIKPDNFLVTSIYPGEDILDKISKSTACLRLIDFGRAIDLDCFDKGICFTTTFSTYDFKCNEMKEQKPWVFQLDWYGVLSCIHTLLFQEYMTVTKKDGTWKIEKKFKRYWFNSLWEPLFNKLLNIPECYEEPDIPFFINMIESKLRQSALQFIGQLSRFSDVYCKRR